MHQSLHVYIYIYIRTYIDTFHSPSGSSSRHCVLVGQMLLRHTSLRFPLQLCFYWMQLKKQTNNLKQHHSHTVRDARDDVLKVATYLTNKSVMTETHGRHQPEFTHPVQKGWEKLSKPQWITAVLSGGR